MAKTDPLGMRKAAAEALIALLGPEDQAAVVEFNQDAHVRSGWVSARDQAQLFGRIAAVSDGDGSTDFRNALKKAAELLADQGSERRKLIILLTDGIMECPPDPATQNPIARGDIFNAILPDMQRRRIEVYTVGLSDEADEPFLHEVSSATGLNANEAHSFHAGTASDLAPIFASMVQYWTDYMVLRTDRMTGGQSVAGIIDQYVSEPRLVAIGDVSGLSVAGASYMPGTASLLRVYPLTGAQSPGTRTVSLSSGECGVLWVGKSSLQLEATGLKPRYGLGELVRVTARPRIGTGTARLTNPRVEARLTLPGGRAETDLLSPAGDAFQLSYSPPETGHYELRLVLNAQDATGNEIFPRPTLTYQFEVMPDFYLLPKTLSFGSPPGGKMVARQIEIHYGLPAAGRANVRGVVQWSSNRRWRQGSALPAVQAADVALSPGAVVNQPVGLRLPSNSLWRDGGHYRGKIQVVAGGQTREVEFWVHLETWWEFWRRIALVVIVLGALVLGYLVYIWAFLASPSGVLMPLDTPTDDVAVPLRLSEQKRNLVSRWFGWRRNCLRLASQHADISLPALPPGMCVELTFYRWRGGGGVWLTNASPRGSAIDVGLSESDLGEYTITPGSAFKLVDGSIISLGDYRFEYQE